MSDQTKQLYFLCGILVGAVAAFAVERTIPIRVKIDPITVKPAVVEVKQKMATTNIGPCACCGGGGGVTVDCCSNTIPSTLTVEVLETDLTNATWNVGTTFSLTWNSGASQWEGVCPGSDNVEIMFKCCGTSNGDFFSGWSNGSGQYNYLDAVGGVVDCVSSALVYVTACDPFEATADSSWFITKFDGTNDATIKIRISE